MNRVRKFVMGGAALALAVVTANGPIASAQEGTAPAKRPAVRGERMHAGFGAAPLISIALKHKAELNLAGDQVANLEKIKSHYDSQVTPLHGQLTAIEKEIAVLMQQSPANLIQVKGQNPGRREIPLRATLPAHGSARERPRRTKCPAAGPTEILGPFPAGEFPQAHRSTFLKPFKSQY